MKLIRLMTIMAAAVVMMVSAASCGSSDKALEKTIDEINKELATQSMPGIEKMFMTMDDSNVIYNYIVDENDCSLEDMKANLSEQRDEIKTSVINDSSNPFIKLVKVSGRGMVFHYEGSASGESYDIEFTNDEI